MQAQPKKTPTPTELNNRKSYSEKAFVIAVDLKKEKQLKEEDFIALRPEGEVSPMQIDDFIGKRLKESVAQYQTVNLKPFYMKKVCVITGTRAEYGLLYWTLKALEKEPKIDLQICVTGMHLSPEFGLTYRQIEADGFTIDYKVETLLSSDTGTAIAKSIGLGTIGFADAFSTITA